MASSNDIAVKSRTINGDEPVTCQKAGQPSGPWEIQPLPSSTLAQHEVSSFSSDEEQDDRKAWRGRFIQKQTVPHFEGRAPGNLAKGTFNHHLESEKGWKSDRHDSDRKIMPSGCSRRSRSRSTEHHDHELAEGRGDTNDDSDTSSSELSWSSSTASSSTTPSTYSGDIGGSSKHLSSGHSSSTSPAALSPCLDFGLVLENISKDNKDAFLAEIHASMLQLSGPQHLDEDRAPLQNSRSQGLVTSPPGPPPACPLPLIPTGGGRSVFRFPPGPPPSLPLPPLPTPISVPDLPSRARNSSFQDQSLEAQVSQKLVTPRPKRRQFEKSFRPHLKPLMEGTVVNQQTDWHSEPAKKIKGMLGSCIWDSL